jgi:ABC-type uncharacterized transport system permease subunit
VIDALFAGALAAYGLAGALSLAYLVGAARRPTFASSAVLAAAAVLHVAHDALRWLRQGVGPFAGIAPALSTLALLVVVAFLTLRRVRPRIESVSAFVTPLAFLLLFASRLNHRGTLVGGAMFALHIGSNLVGFAAFTVASAMAVAYLLLERQVKARYLGGLFHRLPPLDVLDGMAYRSTVVGLPALTVGVITGFLISARGVHAVGLPWQQYFAVVCWLLFAAVLLLRVLAGWRGRRAAIGTILGYASSALVLLFYTVRGGGA